MAYGRISLNHMQQKTPHAAENRSTDNSSDQEETPVDCEHGSRLDWIVSSGEHFCCVFYLFFFFSLFFTQG